MSHQVVISRGSKATTSRVSPKEIERLRKIDNTTVKGVFRCLDPIGGSMKFVWRQYKGDPILMFEMVDGNVYSIPYGLAKQIRDKAGKYEHSLILDAQGNSCKDLQGKFIKKANFEPLDFNLDQNVNTAKNT